ncbi:MAG: carotenoid biosynthesis protein [Candidatus Sericytochromatia bacterium]
MEVINYKNSDFNFVCIMYFMIEEKINTINISNKKNFSYLLELPNILLLALILINIMSIIGYATFSLNTALLAKNPTINVIFSYSYYFFSRTQIIIAFLSLCLLLYKKTKLLWIKEFAFVFTISLLMEFLGTTFGIPFGKYEYTDLLGLKLFSKVPLLIPISWFFMGLSSYCISLKLQEKIVFKYKIFSSIFNIIFASVFLTTWDVTLDPAMSNLTPFWLWEEHNSLTYYGTPVINFAGWVLTSIFIIMGFEFFNTKKLLDKYMINWNIIFYMANLSLPVGLVICSGLFFPVFLTSSIFLIMYSVSFLLSEKKIIK